MDLVHDRNALPGTLNFLCHSNMHVNVELEFACLSS